MTWNYVLYACPSEFDGGIQMNPNPTVIGEGHHAIDIIPANGEKEGTNASKYILI